jgi:hypothetical protein
MQAIQTKNITMKKFIQNSNIPEKLVRGVITQMGGWQSFKECAPDIANHGIDGGFHGFIYYSDTQLFARKFRKEIADLAKSQADDFGTGIIEMIQGFGCFKNSKPTEEEIAKCLWVGVPTEEDDAGIYNALAWYAGEEVARAYAQSLE